MELRTLLLGGYGWEGNPPAAGEDVAALVAAAPVPLPAGYLELLRISDGGDAELFGYPSYVRVWPARMAIQYNRDYEVWRWLPGFVGFGDDGGPEMLGFDARRGELYPVCAVPFVPMNWENATEAAPDFGAFIRRMLPDGGV